MEDLRPCPLCAHDRPERVTLGADPLRVIFIRCPECGCIESKSEGGHPPGTAETLWEIRYDHGQDGDSAPLNVGQQ